MGWPAVIAPAEGEERAFIESHLHRLMDYGAERLAMEFGADLVLVLERFDALFPGSIEREVAHQRLLRRLRFPTVPILATTTLYGRLGLLLPRWAGKLDVTDWVDGNPVGPGLSYVTHSTLRQLRRVRQRAIDVRVRFEDLEILISTKGRIGLWDAARIDVGEHPGQTLFARIDPLIAAVERVLAARRQ